jgi:AraC-like DNA-binding protein
VEEARLGMAERGPPFGRDVEASLLAKKPLAEGGDFVLETVECRCGTPGWSPPEAVGRYGIVFVRRGCFQRRLNGTEFFVDPTVVYFERPDDEQQIAHPAGGGDSCTALYLSEELLAAIWGGEPGLPEKPLATDAWTDLRQRLLLAALVWGDDHDVAELVLELAAEVLGRSEPERVAAGRPATLAARRRVAADAREALVEKPRTGVLELARRVSVSPHHLSRVFKSETGQTISRYRNRLRVRLALERLAAGEPCLARLAADLGFADQAHLARVFKRELGTTPSLLRDRLLGREGAREGDPALDPRR